EAGLVRRLLVHHDHVLVAQPEALARPRLDALDRLGALRSALAGGEARRGGIAIGPEAHAASSHGMSEAWITSGTPFPPTERIARSTSLSPKRCVVTFSSGKRRDASCARASSHAFQLWPRAL